MLSRLLSALLLPLLLSACMMDRTTTNESLAPERVAALEPGVTTAREVVEQLGAPLEVVQLGFRSAYRYEFEVSKRAGLLLIVVVLLNRDTRQDRLWVFFDENDVLTHVGATYESDGTQYAMPWEDIHE